MDASERERLLEDLRVPDMSGEVDLDAHLGLLSAEHKCKGLYHKDVIERVARAAPDVDLFALAGVEPRKYRAFFDYPYAQLLRLNHAGVKVLWPEHPRAEGLRRLGWHAYDALTETQIGRVIFGVLGRDFGRIVSVGAKGWAVSLNFSTVEFVRLGDGRAAYFFEGLPGFISSFQVGVVEGAMKATGVDGSIRVNIPQLDRGVVEFRWAPPRA
jgi:uncharacterized protein (TIGR02265 family)